MKLKVLDPSENEISHFPLVIGGCSLTLKNNYLYRNTPINISEEYLEEEIADLLGRQKNSKSDDFEFFFKRDITVVGKLDEKVVAFNLKYSNNYFHFLVEYLPTLYEFIERKKLSESTIILTGPIHKNFLFILNFVTDNKMTIRSINLYDAIYVKKVFILDRTFFANERIDKVAPKSYYDSQKILNLRNYLFRKLNLNTSFTHKKNRKIFVPRRSTIRNVANLDEIINICRRYSIEIIYPERISFLEQVSIFNNSELILGPMGAWVTNLMFSRENCKAFLFGPHTSKMTLWEDYGSIFNVSVKVTYCQVHKLNKIQPIHSDFVIQPKFFINLLNRLLKNPS